MTLSQAGGEPGLSTSPDDQGTPTLCVVHLARAANGLEPLTRFLDSYEKHSAGLPHELLIVLKGYAEPLSSEVEAILGRVAHSRRIVDDVGVDVDVYFEVARTLDCEAVCFLNSYSVIQAENWLRSLFSALAKPNVGLVGATGSWQSLYISYEDPELVAAARAQLPRFRRIVLRMFPFLRRVKRRFHNRRMRLAFHPFPNQHVRTNGFMIWHDLATTISIRPIRSKFDAYVFESGRSGLTRQIMAMGKRALVVDRSGMAYDWEEWPQSDTFWRRYQPNLMISDNQTRAYDESSGDRRRYLSWLAWGPHCDPGEPR